MVKCLNCGSENPEGSNFCFKCGTQMTIEDFNVKEKINDTEIEQAEKDLKQLENGSFDPKQFEPRKHGNKAYLYLIPIIIFLGLIVYIFINEFDIGAKTDVTTTTIAQVTTTTVKVTTTTSTTTTSTTTTTIARGFTTYDNPGVIKFDILSEPVRASITLDRKYLGTTPFTVQNLTPGKHDIKLDLTGYETYTTSFTAPADKHVILNYLFESKYVTVKFDSTPQGAQIFLDNKPYGFTPFVQEGLFRQKYQVKYILKGYLDYQANIVMKEGLNITAVMQPNLLKP